MDSPEFSGVSMTIGNFIPEEKNTPTIQTSMMQNGSALISLIPGMLKIRLMMMKLITEESVGIEK